MEQFNIDNFQTLCDRLCVCDNDLKNIITEYGYPPMWTRPNTFETLVLTILEQQVSLASAFAAYKKLKEQVVDIIPETILSLTDEALRSCYFSRQKILYVRALAQALSTHTIDLIKLANEEDEVVRRELKQLKGIGDWTADIYLLHALQRTDIFPTGDLALVNSIKMIKGIPSISKEELVQLSRPWQPYRSVATMIFWHYYIKKKNINTLI